MFIICTNLQIYAPRRNLQPINPHPSTMFIALSFADLQPCGRPALPKAVVGGSRLALTGVVSNGALPGAPVS